MDIAENDINPGEQLQKLLKDIYPIEQQDDNNEHEPSFVTNIDYAFKANGNLYQLVYDSTINYLLRRLIFTAGYIKKNINQIIILQKNMLMN